MKASTNFQSGTGVNRPSDNRHLANHKLRLLALNCRFENVMIWNAPPWSLASPQLTHGFPQRLITQSHGGFLPGNITVTAKATNLTLRRLAVCDVACLVSCATTSGAGLSRARLLNLRYAAVRYYRGAFCPQYLASAMVEFGVNFATYQPLSSAALDAQSDSITKGSKQTEAGDDSSDDSDGLAEIEPLISCRFPQGVLREMGKAAGQSAEAGDQASESETGGDSTLALTTLLAQFSSGQAEDTGSESEGDEGCSQEQEARRRVGRGPTAGNSAASRRKRKSNSAGGSAKIPRGETEESEDSQTVTGNAEIDEFISLAFLQQQQQQQQAVFVLQFQLVHLSLFWC